MTTLTTGPVTIYGGGADDPTDLTVTATYDPTNLWNGFVAAPFVTRAEADRLITLVARWEEMSLAFDGDTLVYTTDPGTPDALSDRVEPNADGLYDVGFGWVWEPGPKGSE